MRYVAICLLAAAFGVVGCGGEPVREAALPGVRLAVAAPTDTATTTDESVVVRGTVVPTGAAVLVAGEEATVRDGRFEHTVALAAGANIVDVEAAAPRRPAAMTAVRVTRQVPIEIPDVTDDSPEDAVARLRGLGFEVEQERGGGLLDDLFGGDVGVCGTDPAAGDRALPGTTVTVQTRGSC